jgi:DNA primase
VAIAYDSDEAGQKATARAINLLGETDISVSVLEIKGAKDPDEFIKKFGRERFANLIEGGKGAIRFEVDKLKAKFDLGSAEGNAEFLGEFCKLMASIHSELQRDVYISDVARELSVGKDAIQATIAAARKKNYLQETKKSAHNLHIYAQDKTDPRKATKGPVGLRGFVAEEKLLMLLWKNPEQYDTVKTRISPEDFQSADHRAIYEAVAAELAANRTPDTFFLSGKLGNERMSRLTQLLADSREIQFYPAQTEEYIRAIKAEKDAKTTDEVRDMTPAEYQQYITSLAAKKK